MPGGEANIQTANQPPDLEPRIPTVANLHEPQENTKCKPRQQQDSRGLQEHGLRLRELLDRIEREYGLGEAYGVIIHATDGVDGGVGLEQSAGVGGDIQEAPRRARAEGGVVANRVRRARHGRGFTGTQIKEQQPEGEECKVWYFGRADMDRGSKNRTSWLVLNERMSARVKSRKIVLG